MYRRIEIELVRDPNSVEVSQGVVEIDHVGASLDVGWRLICVLLWSL